MKKRELSERELLGKKNGEIFTPPMLVNEILDKFPDEIWEENKTFCDPAAGNGNILIEVFKRKIALGHPYLVALKTIYGVELMPDNVEEMKQRFLELIPVEYHNDAKQILDYNIQCHDALTWDFAEWKSPIIGIEVRPLIQK